MSLCQSSANLSHKDCETFAVKRLKTDDANNFASEVTILKKLSTVHAHKHLVTLFATYELEGETRPYHLIFPWAEADLFYLWKRFPNPRKCVEMETWISEQCTGLMAALRELHRYWTFSASSVLALVGNSNSKVSKLTSHMDEDQSLRQRRRIFGRHGDIKPDNILWFPTSSTATEPFQGVLKITDFGSARFSTQDGWSNVKSGSVPNSLTYRSPEYEISGVCTTLCDVWALGCMYLEFVAWYSGGHALFDSFANRRLEFDDRLGMPSDKFFTIENDGALKIARLKKSVAEVSSNTLISTILH